MRHHLVIALLLAALSATWPTSAAAQDPAAAQKQFKSGSKQVVADMAPDLAAAKADALGALAAFDTEVTQGDFDLTLAIDLFDSLATFQDAVAAEIEQAAVGLRDAASAALAAHGPWGDALPAGFLPGDAGTFDDQRAAALKKAGQAIAAVRKRIEASSKNLLKKEGLPLLALLDTPQMGIHVASELGAGGWKRPIAIDLVLSVGGLVAVGGDADADLGNVSLAVTTVQGSLKFEVTDIEPDAFAGRFRVLTVDNEFLTPFAPGIYGFQAKQGTQGWAGVDIGVR